MLKRLALCLFAMAAPVSAQNANPAQILAMVQAGAYDEARVALKAGPHNQIDVLFLEAQIRVAQGKLSQAITIYRAILHAQPGNIPIRQALADTLFRNEEWDASRFHFTELRRIDPRDRAQAVYASALQQIQIRKPYGVNTSVTLTPSTNINRGTTTESIESNGGVLSASELGVEESGVGLQAVFGGFYRIPVSAGFVTFRASVSHTLYSEDIFNITVPSASVSYDLGTGRKRFSLSWGVSQTILNEEKDPTISSRTDAVSRSVRLSFSEPLTQRSTMFGSARLTDVEYDDSPTSNGNGLFMEGGVTYALTPTMSLVGAVRAGSYRAAERFASYKIPGVRVGLTNAWSGGWQTYFGGQYELQKYDAVLFGQTDLRKDQEYSLNFNVLNSRINYAGFAPRLTCSWARTQSNFDIYDAETSECALNVTRGF